MKHASLKAYLSTERFKRFMWPVQHSRLQQRTGALGSDPGPSQGVSKRIRLHPRWVHLDLSRQLVDSFRSGSVPRKRAPRQGMGLKLGARDSTHGRADNTRRHDSTLGSPSRREESRCVSVSVATYRIPASRYRYPRMYPNRRTRSMPTQNTLPTPVFVTLAST
jgi:hypothetical protein